MSETIKIGDTVALSSKGASTGRTGQVIELHEDRVRVHWTLQSNGKPMSQRNWGNARELMVVNPSETLKPCNMTMKFELGNDGVEVTLKLNAEEFELLKKCFIGGFSNPRLNHEEINLARLMGERFEKVKVDQ